MRSAASGFGARMEGKGDPLTSIENTQDARGKGFTDRDSGLKKAAPGLKGSLRCSMSAPPCLACALLLGPVIWDMLASTLRQTDEVGKTHVTSNGATLPRRLA